MKYNLIYLLLSLVFLISTQAANTCVTTKVLNTKKEVVSCKTVNGTKRTPCITSYTSAYEVKSACKTIPDPTPIPTTPAPSPNTPCTTTKVLNPKKEVVSCKTVNGTKKTPCITNYTSAYEIKTVCKTIPNPTPVPTTPAPSPSPSTPCTTTKVLNPKKEVVSCKTVNGTKKTPCITNYTSAYEIKTVCKTIPNPTPVPTTPAPSPSPSTPCTTTKVLNTKKPVVSCKTVNGTKQPSACVTSYTTAYDMTTICKTIPNPTPVPTTPAPSPSPSTPCTTTKVLNTKKPVVSCKTVNGTKQPSACVTSYTTAYDMTTICKTIPNPTPVPTTPAPSPSPSTPCTTTKVLNTKMPVVSCKTVSGSGTKKPSACVTSYTTGYEMKTVCKTIPNPNPTPTSIPITKSTKCIPSTITVTVKETVYVTVTDSPTRPTNSNCAGKYAQCGGSGFNGPTCCESGSTCQRISDYYFQCL